MPNQELPWSHSVSDKDCLTQKLNCDYSKLCMKYNCQEVNY